MNRRTFLQSSAAVGSAALLPRLARPETKASVEGNGRMRRDCRRCLVAARLGGHAPFQPFVGWPIKISRSSPTQMNCV